MVVHFGQIRTLVSKVEIGMKSMVKVSNVKIGIKSIVSVNYNGKKYLMSIIFPFK